MADGRRTFERKPRKDGSTRKARVFGKPWWVETAGWSLEKWEERRSAILEKLKESFPDLHDVKQATDQNVADCIKPLVETFDDSTWCMPNSTDTAKRLEEQLKLYTAWARFISRELSRAPPSNRNPIRRSSSVSESASLERRLSIPDSEQATIRPTPKSRLSNVQDVLSHQPDQINTRIGTPGKLSGMSHGFKDPAAHRRIYSFSRDSPQHDGRRRRGGLNDVTRPISPSYSFVASPETPYYSPPIADDDLSIEETDQTEVDEASNSLVTDVSGVERGRSSNADLRKAGLSNEQTSHGQYARVWKDEMWDDVVVEVDATAFNGKRYPIPMSMLKPGSNRESCRWDDFELDNLYTRFAIESGEEIDRTRFVALAKIGAQWNPIDTPGKYKLMLRRFAQTVRLSSTMALNLRFETPKRNHTNGRRRSDHPPDSESKRRAEKSQFTGAASDFSSDSEDLPSQPSLKRRRSRNWD